MAGVAVMVAEVGGARAAPGASMEAREARAARAGSDLVDWGREERGHTGRNPNS